MVSKFNPHLQLNRARRRGEKTPPGLTEDLRRFAFLAYSDTKEDFQGKLATDHFIDAQLDLDLQIKMSTLRSYGIC